MRTKCFGWCDCLKDLLPELKRHDFIIRTMQYQHRVIHALDILCGIEIITRHHQA